VNQDFPGVSLTFDLDKSSLDTTLIDLSLDSAFMDSSLCDNKQSTSN
jgi:hypothetical protein